MITPKLEEMILCGKAFFKTFVAGGDKHTLTFGDDRFIIITDITYFPMNITTNQNDNPYQNRSTQVAIYGERGYNHFIFRNWNDAGNETLDFCSPVTINTYLLHDQQVGFSFCNAPYFINQNIQPPGTHNPGYEPPLEWGIEGQPSVTPTIINMNDASGSLDVLTTQLPNPGKIENTQLFFPFNQVYQFSPFDTVYSYPLLHVNYVEVLGSANNIQI